MRYILSRINYSTSIGVYELASEMNNFGKVDEYSAPDAWGGCGPLNPGVNLYTPYHSDNDFATKGGEWLIEMANYMKNVLNCKEHPLATCYTGDPVKHPNSPTGPYSVYSLGDDSYQSNLFDIVGYNFYQTHIKKHINTMESVQKYVWNPFDEFYVHKPLMYAENDMDDIDGCSNNTEWLKSVYITPFTGVAGAFNWGNSFSTWLWPHYGNVREFLDLVLPYNNISSSIWRPHHRYIDVTSSSEEPQVEFYCLKNDYGGNSDRAFGIVVNRTYNGLSVYNNTPGLWTTACDELKIKLTNNSSGPASFPEDLNTLTSIADIDAGHKLKVWDMETGDYNIKWYNPFNMDIVQVNLDHVNVLTHKLELDFPNLGVFEGSPDFLPFVFFTAYKDETKSLIIQPSDTATLTAPEAGQPFTCTVYPNPQNNLSPVNIHCGLNIKSVSLFTAAGRHVHTYEKVVGSISLPLLSRGIYQIKISLDDESIQNHKLIALDWHVTFLQKTKLEANLTRQRPVDHVMLIQKAYFATTPFYSTRVSLKLVGATTNGNFSTTTLLPSKP